MAKLTMERLIAEEEEERREKLGRLSNLYLYLGEGTPEVIKEAAELLRDFND